MKHVINHNYNFIIIVIILYAKLIINYYIYDVLVYDICNDSNVTMFMNYSLYMLLTFLFFS
jgi:hypothetical protein